MKFINLNYLVIIIYLISSSFSYSIEPPDIKNLIIHKDRKKIENVDFFNFKGQKISINNYVENTVMINFWATWCAPCRKEMPDLDALQSNNKLENLKIFPINVGKEKIEKAEKFFLELKIKNLDIYFDDTVKLANLFSLRGIPTSVIINKNGEEFARIMGAIDFTDKKFVEWLRKYN